MVEMAKPLMLVLILQTVSCCGNEDIEVNHLSVPDVPNHLNDPNDLNHLFIILIPLKFHGFHAVHDKPEKLFLW